MRKPVAKLVAGMGMLAGSLNLHAADLMDVYSVALDNDPQLQAAEAQYRAAREARPQAVGQFLPKLNISGARTQIESDYNDSFRPELVGTTRKYYTSDYSLNLLQPIYHQDYFAQLKQADARVAQAEAQFGSTQQAEIVRVSQAYFLVLGSMDNLRFAQAEKKATEQQLRQTQQRFEVGLTAITDVHEARAGYDLAVSQEIQAKNQLDTAVEQLRELTGRSFEEYAKLDGVPLVLPEPSDIEAWVNMALKQNLDLIAADAQVQVAQQEARRQRFQRYPTLDLQASYGHSENPVFSQDTDDKIISLQLNFPFYQGGLISSRSREAEQLYNQALAILEQQRRATTRQTRDAYLSVTSGIAQVKAAKQALESTRTALEATQAGFEVGTRTTIDVLNSQQAVFGAERDYARARYDYILSTLQLKQAAGSLSVEDLKKVNALLH